MTANLVVAAMLNALTFLVHAAGLIALTRLMKFLPGEAAPDRRWGKLVGIFIAAFGLFILLCIEIGIWAVSLVGVGAFSDFETAFYFSTSSFATIGFGDVAPAHSWRLLAAMEGVTGFLIIGWSSAYLVMSGIRFGPFERDTHF
ncbi:MAG: two pore domain potassium channel family protein [Pseudaminobacter sp.]|nr:two pore domain potassium channel family protein [Pseudaminobacter sp.]